MKFFLVSLLFMILFFATSKISGQVDICHDVTTGLNCSSSTVSIFKTVLTSLPVNCSLNFVVPKQSAVQVIESTGLLNLYYDNLEGCCDLPSGPIALTGLIANSFEFKLSGLSLLTSLFVLNDGICFNCIEQFCLTCNVTAGATIPSA